MRRLMMMVAVFALAGSGFAELKLATVFSDGMVLQRDQKVPVWGWAEPGAEVTVSFAGKDKAVKADKDGKFMVRLKKMAANAEPQLLVVKSDSETVEVKNVLVGEVWLCSGQSNMEWSVSKTKDFETEKAAADYPLIRMFLTDRAVANLPKQDCTGSWQVCRPETVGGFSATAYFFGRELHTKLGVPVGLIRTCWGGTRIEAWSPMESLEQFEAIMQIKKTADEKASRYDPADAQVQFEKKLATWSEAATAAKAAGKKVPRKPGKANAPLLSQHYPANLYNAMIHPFVPYGMRGAIWYQGESNTKTISMAMLYRDLLENMVNEWRDDWGDRFSFYAVQLVNFKKEQVAPIEDTGWAFIRDSFLTFHKEVPNAGIAVGIDVGEAKNIHPKNKQAIGCRLAQQALANTYGKKVVAGGPIYKSMKVDGNKVVIKFEDIGSGLVEQGGVPLKRFAIAGADKQFVAAQAVIVENRVIVSSSDVTDPVAVRYAWADNPVGCNLFNKEGFPASPFRTDDWAPVAE
ncbi:MAG: sialate O-acetylesterase [Pontiella sp.]